MPYPRCSTCARNFVCKYISGPPAKSAGIHAPLPHMIGFNQKTFQHCSNIYPQCVQIVPPLNKRRHHQYQYIHQTWSWQKSRWRTHPSMANKVGFIKAAMALPIEANPSVVNPNSQIGSFSNVSTPRLCTGLSDCSKIVIIIINHMLVVRKCEKTEDYLPDD